MDVLERIEKDGLHVFINYGVMEEFDWREGEKLSKELIELAKLGKQSNGRERVLREALTNLTIYCEVEHGTDHVFAKQGRKALEGNKPDKHTCIACGYVTMNEFLDKCPMCGGKIPNHD